MDQLKDELRGFILENFLPGENPSNLKDDTPLIGSGILDSHGTLAVVMFLEEQCGIKVDAYETSPENFDSIDRIAAFVQAKKA
jgi:acyl carrier protein